MALNGDGFFVVSNKSSTGTSESYYTRAGNFRMGENGTLQDSNGNEVQGWALSAIDTETDVTSTNNNLTSFTDVSTEIAGNQIVQFSDSIETYAAKTTDYSATAAGDASELSGSGVKSQSTKISDIESLITNYSNALSTYASDPEALSSPSIAQSTMIDLLPGIQTSNLSSEGNQLYVYINGNKITQNYVDSSASTEQMTALDADATIDKDVNGDGFTTTEDYNILVSRIATYEALADKISNITGLNAYTVKTTTAATGETYTASTDYADVLDGKIKIDSIIPGKAFTIGDLSEVNGSTEQDGTKTTVSENVVGTGESAVTSAMEALRDAVAGNQLDAYMPDDIFSDDTGAVQIFDTADTVSYTIGNATVSSTGFGSKTATINDLVSKINSNGTLNLLVEAQNINGNLVIKSKDAGEEFSGILKFTDNSATTTYTKDRNIDVSGNTGAGAEFMEIVSNVQQTEFANSSIQLKMNTLGLTDSSFGEFSVDDTGLITITQDGIDYVVGQVAIAQFNNNIGLEAIGDNLYAKTTESGDPVYSVANDNGVSIEGETLELSTADLSESLVNLMVFQRAFEANAKSITTADSILQTLINLKQ